MGNTKGRTLCLVRLRVSHTISCGATVTIIISDKHYLSILYVVASLPLPSTNSGPILAQKLRRWNEIVIVQISKYITSHAMTPRKELYNTKIL
jgi:hypothetical protein